MKHDKHYNRHEKEMFEVLTRAGEIHLLEDLMKCLMSPYELEEITQRLQIIRRLRAGATQREIAKDFQIGIATVSRSRRAAEEYKNTIDKILK